MRLEKLTIRGLGPFREEATLDLTAIPHQIVAITGANGEGKSTLLELFPGALYRACPTRGSLASLATRRDSMVEAVVVNGERFGVRQIVDAVSGKGETLLTDADGEAINTSGKLREADGWISKHIVPPEVLYASTFAHQGSGGFIDLKPADRKKVLLRILGIERLEALAERARERSRAAREELRVVLARIEDEEKRGAPAEDVERELERLRAEAVAANKELESARLEVGRIRGLRERIAEEARAFEENERRRRELEQRLSVLNDRQTDLEKRVANNRGVLSRADEIRAAMARAEELDEQLRRLEISRIERERAIEGAQRVHDEFLRRLGEMERERAALGPERLRAEAVIQTWAERVQHTQDGYAELVAERDDARETLERLEAELADLQGQRLAGAEERIGQLREGLGAISDEAQSLEDARLMAQVSLDTDDGAVEQAKRLPEELEAARKNVSAARSRLERANAEVAEAQRVIERSHEVAIARDDLERIASRDAELQGEIDALKPSLYQAEEAVRVAQSAPIVDANEVTRERAELEQTLRLRQPLEQAEARLAELGPQLAETNKERRDLVAELAALPVLKRPEEAPDSSEADARLERAERAVVECASAIAVAERDLEAARAVAARVAELSQERGAIEAELADWTRLGADLGKDGIQALEIDAAGPELTELVNDLLRSCHGSRFTVSIETTKLSSDGKRQLEGCEVHVIDTVRGREGAAETFSGGERVIIGEAVSLALSVLACRRAGLERPTLVRDESGAALDAANGRAYMAMLRRAAEMIDADKVLFVSHTPELQELADARVIIESGQIRLEGGAA